MARIRTIKPETPQSETMGKLTRDARLLFILLWTVLDDDGRARASSRMLASLLYPYDDDVPNLIEGWLSELEKQNCIRRYIVDGSHYLDVPNWRKHQKIDHPSASRLPSFDDGSPSPREASRSLAPDLGPSTGTLDQGSTSLRSVDKRASALSLEFENEFWPKYPHKVGKPAARRAWNGATQRASLGEILTGLDRYIREKPPDRPWLNPATFLNQDRWSDAPAPTSTGPPKQRVVNGFAAHALRLRDQDNATNFDHQNPASNRSPAGRSASGPSGPEPRLLDAERSDEAGGAYAVPERH